MKSIFPNKWNINLEKPYPGKNIDERKVESNVLYKKDYANYLYIWYRGDEQEKKSNERITQAVVAAYTFIKEKRSGNVWNGFHYKLTRS